jgi:hypothetical protein
MEIVKSVVLQRMLLQVGDVSYTIEYPLTSVMKAEEKLGRALKSPSDWFCAQAKDIPALLEAGLAKHHPNVTPEEVQAICDGLSAEAYVEVTEALGALNFPKWLERFKETLEKSQGKLPNVPSVAVH